MKASKLVKGKEKAQSPAQWTNHIQPDSRRRRVRIQQSSASSDSGESFDFMTVNEMPSDEDHGKGAGQTSSAKVPIPQVVAAARTTFGPHSQQERLGLITSVCGAKISKPPSIPARQVTCTVDLAG